MNESAAQHLVVLVLKQRNNACNSMMANPMETPTKSQDLRGSRSGVKPNDPVIRDKGIPLGICRKPPTGRRQ